jgi:quercetin dioxygenase-like cupin family protein
MKIIRTEDNPSTTPPAAYFTGKVSMASRFTTEVPARTGGAIVTFQPGARTAWHTHPLGQTVIVTAGTGWAQCEGEPKEEIRPGDIVWFPPDVRHWHGATDTSAMTHIAIAEALDGVSVDWMEHVGDDQYLGPLR